MLTMLFFAAAVPARAGKLDILLDRFVKKSVIDPGGARKIRIGTQRCCAPRPAYSPTSGSAVPGSSGAEFTDEELKAAFDCLDDLRASGITNMPGARSPLIRELGWDKHKTAQALTLWRRTLNNSGMEERVTAALNMAG